MTTTRPAQRRLLKAVRHLKKRFGHPVSAFFVRRKKPLAGTHGFHDATDDPAKLRRLAATCRAADGIAIATGRDADVLVFDVDDASGEDLLRRLARKLGVALPDTLEACSRPRHRQLFFRYPKGLEIGRVIKVQHEGVRHGLDVLGNGGYVVLPPSVHPKTRQAYRWIHRRVPAELPKKWRAWLRTLGARDARHGWAARLPDVVTEGERDTLLTSLAGSARRRGASEEGILALLQVENDLRVSPPLPDQDLVKIARSVARYKPLPFDFREQINDINLARRFAALEQQSLRYVPAWKAWRLWDGRHWAPDVTFEATRRVEAMVRGLLDQIGSIPKLEDRDTCFKALNRYTNRSKIDDVLAMARSQQRLVVAPDAIDTDPWLFNVQNGTLDLRTGTLREHDPRDLITKLAPVVFDSKASAPQWQAFLARIFRHDTDMLNFVQRGVGYTLIGEPLEHVLFFCYGGGANGKTTFLETLLDLFGDYGVMIEFATLLHHRNPNSDSRDLPRLHKARFAAANETPTNARWDERIVKMLTGGDTLGGRWLYQERFQFRPTHTLWCRANDQPASQDLSDAFWRRLKLMPFKVRIPDAEQTKDLHAQLRAELPGILNWALAGCLAYQRDGLQAPKVVERATANYRADQNSVSDFIAACCVVQRTAWTPTSELYAVFREWWATTHGPRYVPSDRTFAQLLRHHRGITARRQKRAGQKVRGWQGIGLPVGGLLAEDGAAAIAKTNGHVRGPKGGTKDRNFQNPSKETTP